MNNDPGQYLTPTLSLDLPLHSLSHHAAAAPSASSSHLVSRAFLSLSPFSSLPD